LLDLIIGRCNRPAVQSE